MCMYKVVKRLYRVGTIIIGTYDYLLVPYFCFINYSVFVYNIEKKNIYIQQL